MHKVAVLVGSLSTQSINLRFAQAIEILAKGRLAFNFQDLSSLPLYNRDLDANMPDPVLSFRDAMRSADAYFFVTPEYNRSIPAALKNAIEWGARPPGQSIFPGRPAATAGASPGNISTAQAQMILRYMVTHLGMYLLPQPEMFIKFAPEAYDDANNVKEESLAKLLNGFIDQFDAWIARFKP